VKAIIGDRTLAHFVENVVAIDTAAYVEALKKLFSEQKFGVFKFSGGTSCFAGRSPFSITNGFGTDDVIHGAELLNQIEDFYGQFNCSPVLSVSSVSASDSLRVLFERGYSPICFRNVYVHDQSRAAQYDDRRNLRVVKVQDDVELACWIKVVSDGYAGRATVEPDVVAQGQSIKDGNHFFLAYLHDEVAAAASVYVNGTLANLGGMATLLPFRCMGLQQMLLKHRLDFARAMNCSVIISDTDPGNQSQRNLERSGFNLAYVRGIYRRPVTGKPI
jgi:hypothetical protein